jgi:hypothetical protein
MLSFSKENKVSSREFKIEGYIILLKLGQLIPVLLQKENY